MRSYRSSGVGVGTPRVGLVPSAATRTPRAAAESISSRRRARRSSGSCAASVAGCGGDLGLLELELVLDVGARVVGKLRIGLRRPRFAAVDSEVAAASARRSKSMSSSSTPTVRWAR